MGESMKKPAVATLLALAVTICSTAAFGKELDVKGLHLGMTKTEIEKKFGALPLNNFTIAGVAGKFPVRLEFYEDKLDELMFFFPSASFSDVRKAVVSENPEIKCTDSTIKSPEGKSFIQVDCKLADKLGTLKLDRFVRDINTSAVTLTSHRLFNELENKRKEKQKDKSNKPGKP
jgi:hypothetical protein